MKFSSLFIDQSPHIERHETFDKISYFQVKLLCLFVDFYQAQ